MASQTVAEKVLTRMSASKGSVWSAGDLSDLGSRSGIDQALRRLWLAGKIRKVARGLYDYPQVGTVVGVRAPRADRAVQAAARGRGASIRPSGSVAANALGLSTQVPARLEYLTDGIARTITVGGQTVRLRRVSPKRLKVAPGAGALIEALRYLGKDAVAQLTDGHMARVARTMQDADIAALRNARRHAPVWMLPAISRVLSAATPAPHISDDDA
jgi:hypothetical protein